MWGQQQKLRKIQQRETLEQSISRRVRLLPGQRHFFFRFLNAYRRVRFALPVTASNPDPFCRMSKWSASGCHFVLDCRRALAACVENRADRQELITTWAKLLASEDDPVIGRQEKTLITLMMPFIQERGLDPHSYFKPLWGRRK